MSDYLEHLSTALQRYGVDQPVVVIDLDRLDANCAVAHAAADSGLGRRLVAKSLPCLPLLDRIRGMIPTSGLMTFSEPMVVALLSAEPDTDHLMGKPLPVSSAARILTACPDAADRVQWLIDTPERLRAYLDLATDAQRALRLSLEVDIGLHRGGFKPTDLAGALSVIDDHPHARLSGLMGYEAHLAKMPQLLKKHASRSSEGAFERAVGGLPKDADLCLNTGGSLTFQSYSDGGVINDLSFGSILVKPSDFDHASTERFKPAAFIATPILKVMPSNAVPGMDFLPRRKTDLAIFGGHFLANPVFPKNFGYSSIFGHSSNQEVWTGPRKARVAAGDVALLRPTQSEAVLNQFGRVLAMQDGQVVHEWTCLPN